MRRQKIIFCIINVCRTYIKVCSQHRPITNLLRKSLIKCWLNKDLPPLTGVSQPLSLARQAVDFVGQGGQVALDGLVLALQGLDIGQVLAVVVAGDDGVLLADPGDGLVDVAVEALHLVGAEEALLALRGVLSQAVPGVVDLLLLGADLRHVRMRVDDELVRAPVQLDHLVLVVAQVLLELFVLLLQDLDMLQVCACLL